MGTTNLIATPLVRARERLAGMSVEAALITNIENVRWMSGFSGSSAAIVLSSTDAVFITDSRYDEQAHERLLIRPTLQRSARRSAADCPARPLPIMRTSKRYATMLAQAGKPGTISRRPDAAPRGSGMNYSRRSRSHQCLMSCVRAVRTVALYSGANEKTVRQEKIHSMSEREIDQQLVERAQGGDKHAFEMLVAKYQRKLGRLLSRFIRDPAEVEDVAQEAFIKAYRALPSFRGESAFYTWLYRIGINTAKNYLVAQGRRAPTSTDFDADEAETFEDADQLRDINTPESLMQSKQVAETVNAAMESLPEELRTAIVLREIEGLSYEEIAEVMSCPIGTVRSRIFRAREAVAARLRPLLDTSPDRRW